MSNDTSAFEQEFADKTADIASVMGEMEYQLGLDYAPAWRPENDGDMILGTITALAMGHSEWGTYPIITVLTSGGEMFAIHGFHTILKQRLIEIRPMVDEILGVKYLGHILPDDTNSKNVNDYYAYKVLINRPANDIWDKFAPAI
jgi:hypothetical protein